MENITISCSPETYRRVETDEEYRIELTQRILSDEGGPYDEVIFTESSLENSEQMTPGVDAECKMNDGKLNWQDASTKLMLSLMEDLRPKLGKTVQLKTKGKMYQVIAKKMSDEGYNYTAVQIENKFRGLERNYKKTVLHNRQTGRNRQTCPFESELNQILGQKKGIHPEFVLESSDTCGPSSSQVSIDENSDTDSVKDDLPSCSRFSKKRTKSTVPQQVMQKIDEMIKEKKEFHSKMMDILQKKEEREMRREERSQKKLQLLEKLVKKKKNRK